MIITVYVKYLESEKKPKSYFEGIRRGPLGENNLNII